MSADPTATRLGLLNAGYMPTPICPPNCNHVDRHGKACKSGGKAVHISAWVKGNFTASDIRSWSQTRPKDCNTGLLCGELCAIDGDILDPVLAEQANAIAEQYLGPTPLVRIGRAPKWLRGYRVKTPLSKLATPERTLRGETIQVEIMGQGQQIAAYGTHPVTMQPYRWMDREPLNVPLQDLPVVSEEQLRGFLAAVDALFAAAGAKMVAKQPKATTGGLHINGHAADGPNDAASSTSGDSFFRKVNQAALANIRPWFTVIFPAATQEAGTGAWRVSSANLGRSLEEDLSMHPTAGGQDFGTRESLSPITLVMRWKDMLDAKTAAHWLCNQLGKNPVDLGWKSGKTADHSRLATLESSPVDEGSGLSTNDRSLSAKHNGLVLNPGSPLISAREFIRRQHSEVGLPTLHHQADTFYTWARTHYAETTEEELRSQLYDFLDKAHRPVDRDKIVPFDPTRGKVANILEATAAAAQLPFGARSPFWLGHQQQPPAAELIACANGLLHLPTGKLLPHTPAFFTVNALPFAYQPNAPEPDQWLDFLSTLWPQDQPSIDTLQEIFGLALTGETRHQKAFMLVGPKRSGKGTIARVLTKLLGQANVCGPTLSSLSQNFGLAPLVGKRLAIISDARLSGKTDQSIIVERILAITGEDSLTIDRKFLAAWTGQLEVRFVLLTNELPRFTDASGALASRFVILIFKDSFFGREDHGLLDRLVLEMPSILNWSIAGLKRLQERGYFIQPASSEAAQQELEDLGSPVATFLRERCTTDPRGKVEVGILFDAWVAWCRDNNRDHPGTKQVFGRDLRAVLPGLTVSQPHTLEGISGRRRYYEGIVLSFVNW